MRILIIVVLLFALNACDKEADSTDPSFEVVYVDIKESCGWNLLIADGIQIFNYQETRKDSFLHSNIEEFNSDNHLSFGDILNIEFEVLPIAPDNYPVADWQCNRWEGIPIRITKLIE